MSASSPQRIVVGVTGASGALYAARLIQLLVAAEVETHLVVSPLGQRLLRDELGMERVDLTALAGTDTPSRRILIAPPHQRRRRHHRQAAASVTTA